MNHLEPFFFEKSTEILPHINSASVDGRMKKLICITLRKTIHWQHSYSENVFLQATENIYYKIPARKFWKHKVFMAFL